MKIFLNIKNSFINVYQKGSLIADDAIIGEVEEGDFESEAEEEADTEESESGSSIEGEEENESEDESRATGEITYNSESEDSEELDNLEMDEKNMEHYNIALEHLLETKNTGIVIV